jgi:hypothetical protein
VQETWSLEHPLHGHDVSHSRLYSSVTFGFSNLDGVVLFLFLEIRASRFNDEVMSNERIFILLNILDPNLNGNSLGPRIFSRPIRSFDFVGFLVLDLNVKPP